AGGLEGNREGAADKGGRGNFKTPRRQGLGGGPGRECSDLHGIESGSEDGKVVNGATERVATGELATDAHGGRLALERRGHHAFVEVCSIDPDLLGCAFTHESDMVPCRPVKIG